MSLSTITLAGNPVNLVAMPATPGLSDVEFGAFDGVGVTRSPFTGKIQMQQWHGGDMWSGVAHLPPLARADADAWIAFLEELRGEANAFQMGDPAWTARGSGTGTPFVDNALNGGNPAGSLMLGTKGWTPNAQGVLWVGDYIQVGFRLYRVLDVVNADSSGQATFPIWPSLREQPTADGTAAGWVNATGSALKFASYTLGSYSWGVLWSSFAAPVPALPADAVIQGIYPVIVASGNFDICFQYLKYGTDLTLSSGGIGFTSPYATNPIAPGASFASTQFYGASIGTTLAALSGQAILIAIDSSELDLSISDSIAATGVGFAIYYTSATPVTDPTMPPPFAVPSGQGLAWSVPLSGAGVGSGDTGSSTGTPAINNGGLQTQIPQGLWRLADNKRNYATDIDRDTPLMFPFKEYR